MSVVAGVDDLFFLARILEAARQTGVAVESIPPASIQQRLLQGAAGGVILDLNSAAAVDVIRKLKQEPATRHIRIVGFVSHVATGVVSAAKAAGCDLVLARSTFSKQLPELLRGFCSEGTSSSEGLRTGVN